MPHSPPTTGSGATSATGTSSSRSRACGPTRRPRRRSCGCSSGRSSCCTRSCRSSPRRSGPTCPAIADLLAASPWPAPERELIDDEAEQVVGEAIEAVTELRRYRDEAGVTGGRDASRAGERAAAVAGAHRTPRAARVRRWRRRRAGGDHPRDRDPRLRRHLRCRPGRSASKRAGRTSRARSRAPKASSRTRASSRRRRPRWSRESATSSPALQEELGRRSDDLPGGRGLPARPRAVRDAVRARPHAQADDRARDAAAAVRLDPRGRLEREVVDRAHDRGDPGARGAEDGLVHVAAPAHVRRAGRGRGAAAAGARVRRGGRARRARRGARQPHARRRRRGHAVRGADGGRVPRTREQRRARSP